MGDINKYKLLIYSNSNELQLFLKSKKIKNYEYHIHPQVDNDEKLNDMYFNKNNFNEDENIKILVLNTDMTNYRDYIKDINNLREKYELIFLYGINNASELSSKNLYDIRFKDYNEFINYFEMVYYTFNGLNYFSLGIELFMDKFGNDIDNLKIFTRENIDEILNDLRACRGKINRLLYFEKSLSNRNNIFKVSDKLECILDFLNLNGSIDVENIFSWIVVDNDENDEEFMRIFVL